MFMLSAILLADFPSLGIQASLLGVTRARKFSSGGSWTLTTKMGVLMARG